MDTLTRRKKKIRFVFSELDDDPVEIRCKGADSIEKKAHEALRSLLKSKNRTFTIGRIDVVSDAKSDDKTTIVESSTLVRDLFRRLGTKKGSAVELIVSPARTATDDVTPAVTSLLADTENCCQGSGGGTDPEDGHTDPRRRSATESFIHEISRHPKPSQLLSPKRHYSYSVKNDVDLRKRPAYTRMIRFSSFRKRNIVLKLLLPCDESVCLFCPGDMTVKELKDKYWDALEKEGHIDRNPQLAKKENFVLKYVLNGDVYELFDQLQMLQTLRIYREIWTLDPKEAGELILAEKRTKTDDEKRLDLQIGYCMDMDLRSMAQDDQLDWHRRVLVNVCRQGLRKRDSQMYAMEPDVVHNLPLPSHVLDNCSFCGEIQIDFFCGNDAPDSTHYFAEFNVEMIAAKIVAEAYWHYNHPGLVSGALDDYTLKVCGYEDYVWGSHKIVDFKHIRQCIVDEMPVQLTLVKKPDFAEDDLPAVPEMDLVDDSGQLNGIQEQLTAQGKTPEEIFVISMWDLEDEFRIKIVGVDLLQPLLRNKKVTGSPMLEKMGNVFVEAAIYHGGEPLSAILTTKEMPFCCNPRFQEWLNFGIKTKDIPKAARLCLVVKAYVRGGKARVVPLQWTNIQLLDHRSVLRCGEKQLGLWSAVPSDGDDLDQPGSGMQPDCALGPNTAANATVVHVTFPSYADGHPVVCPSGTFNPNDTKTAYGMKVAARDPPKDSEIERCLCAAIKKDSLDSLTAQEKDAIWVWQDYVGCNFPEALPKCFLSVNYANQTRVVRAHEMLQKWSRPISLEIALQLLNSHFSDEKVRKLAIKCLKRLSNEKLQLYLLQLIQGLKYEPYDDSALARFLLIRALRSKAIGHSFFWYLRAELQMSKFVNRFGALLEAYLRYCGKAMLNEIYCECQALKALNPIASSLQQMNEPKDKGIAHLHERLTQCKLMPSSFLLPYNFRLRVGKLLVPQCKFMMSSKKPLWLEFENADPSAKNAEPVKIIFKLGDDLRQDMLTLRTLTVMDRLWQENGLNLHILPYGCTATGVKEGVIEVVSPGSTITRIHMAAGSKSFNEKAISNWLGDHVSDKTLREKAERRFVNSCAGYCVASYVLGIADRHGDNIMVKTNGNLVHLDFGHFLGNVKHFRLWRLKIKKEILPFALGADFVHVMGGEKSSAFKTFRSTCGKAYNVLRKNAGLIVDLFHLMKSIGMKELASTDDIVYLKEKLMPEASSEAAEKHFQSQIDICIKGGWSSARQQISEFIHYLSQSQKQLS